MCNDKNRSSLLPSFFTEGLNINSQSLIHTVIARAIPETWPLLYILRTEPYSSGQGGVILEDPPLLTFIWLVIPPTQSQQSFTCVRKSCHLPGVQVIDKASFSLQRNGCSSHRTEGHSGEVNDDNSQCLCNSCEGLLTASALLTSSPFWVVRQCPMSVYLNIADQAKHFNVSLSPSRKTSHHIP